jgi:CSLREA domain-containing protein
MLLVALLLGANALMATTTQAATLTVTKTADTADGTCDAQDCSLREAIVAAASGDEIVFALPLFNQPQVITLSEAQGFQELFISRSLTIAGKGAQFLTIRRDPSATAKFRIFNLENTIEFPVVSLSGMTITGGDVRGIGEGGGIRSYQVSLNLTNCVVTGNRADRDGAINVRQKNELKIVASTISNNTAIGSPNAQGFSGGINCNSLCSLTIANSTVSGNVLMDGKDYNAGGIYSDNNVTITGSTITDNAASGSGSAGGILKFTGTVTVRNSIIAANRNNNSTPDVYSAPFGGTVVSEGYNIVGYPRFVNFNQIGDQIGTASNPLDPRLLQLADNGGETPTHRLKPDSPAVDKGKAFGLTTDQRGSTRPINRAGISPAPGGDESDIGAFEADSFTFTVTKIADTKDGACDAADCSLRDALEVAAQDDVIEFAAPLFNQPQTITLTSSLEIQGKVLTLAGKGAQLLTLRRASGAPPFRIFTIVNADVVLAGMTIMGGSVNGDGGGIFATESLLIVKYCHITGNTASARGGGIGVINNSELHLVNGTVSGNVSNDSGPGSGGIYSDKYTFIGSSTLSGNMKTVGNNNGGGIWASGGLDIVSSTIADNEAAGAGSAGGVFKNGGTVGIRNTLLAANRNNSIVPDAAGAFSSYGYNLVGNVGKASGFDQVGDQKGSAAAPLDPLLRPLALVGGTTPTHGFTSFSSPAIDKGAEPTYITDQRGLSRPFDNPSVSNASGVNANGADIGAFEAQSTPTAASVAIGGRILTPENRGLRNAVVTLTDINGRAQTVVTGAFGDYRFADVVVGQTIVISVVSKRYEFQPQVITLAEEINDLNFTAEQLKTSSVRGIDKRLFADVGEQ